MTNQNPQTTYTAMREAISRAVENAVFFEESYRVEISSMAFNQLRAALALPEPSEPDPAQELLASVQLFDKQLQIPNKADAEALVRMLKAVRDCLVFRTGTLDLSRAYEEATPLIKQIAGGG